NNPVLIGEPGVGKTAIVEGLALRIARGDVPEGLKDKRLISLDLGSMVAGAKYRGEFEERLKAVLKDVTDAAGQLILSIYEQHHKVRIKDAALVAAAVLSHRYIADRFLPDKAIDLIDEAAAKLRVEATSMPAELDEARRRIMQLEIEREGLRKEKDKASQERLERIEQELASLKEQAGGLEAQWPQELDQLNPVSRLQEQLARQRLELEQARQR